MNISYNWLRRYVECELTPEELAADLTSIGLECDTVEEVESIRGGLRGLVIGRVLTCEEHPDSDHLHVTTVDLGMPDGPVQIVCGAPNVAAGQAVVVATVGTVLYDGDKEFKIKKSKIRGVESFGMICAEDEIGVGASHDGIIVIPDDKAPAPGTPAAQYFGLESDYVLEVDLTPNRIDGASHYGVARDWAAKATDCGLKPGLHRPSADGFAAPADNGEAVKVRVESPADCPRYAGVTIRGVKVGESPKWLRDLLTAIGQRPINNVVDVTNFILHSFCQPLHCFDVAKIKGGEVIVKTAEAGTRFVTLDGVERELHERDLMICNAEEPMCLAGVFGGLGSGVTEEATDIFLESACFNPTTIRKAARRHGLNTDASFRFERGVDPNGCLYALQIAAMMVVELGGGRICGPVVDIYPEPVKPAEVKLSFAQIDRLVGAEIPADRVRSILKSLDIEITDEKDGEMSLAIPTYRVDVTRPCDVIEEILRIYGYNNVGFTDHLSSSLSYETHTDRVNSFTRKVMERMAAQGFYEILNNSLTSVSYYPEGGEATYPLSRCVNLLNPLSAELSVMRQTLLYGGLESIAHNINRRNPDLMFVEQGNVYRFNPGVEPTAGAPLAPYAEESHLALWITGNVRAASWLGAAEPATVYHLRGYLEGMLAALGLDSSRIQMSVSHEMPDIYSAEMTVATRSGKPLGHMGVLNHGLLARFDIDRSVFYAELDWEAVTSLAEKLNVTFKPLPRTQAVRRDLALLIDSGVTFDRIEEVVCRSERKLLRGVELFDVYEGKNLPAGKKSYAISVILQDDEKTLQDKQIEAVMAKITSNLASTLGATLR